MHSFVLEFKERTAAGGSTCAWRVRVKCALGHGLSRGSLGRPLRLLEHLLMEVRMGLFLPDVTRSGRFPGKTLKEYGVVVDDSSNFSY